MNTIKMLLKDVILPNREILRIYINREEDSEYHSPKIEGITIVKGDSELYLPHSIEIGLLLIDLGKGIIQKECESDLGRVILNAKEQ